MGRKKGATSTTSTTVTLEQAQKAYDEGRPIVTDAQFDAMTEEAPLSLSKPTDGEVKVKHEIPMLSQGKCHSAEEVVSFMANTKDTLYSATLKIDGFACSLMYMYGKLVMASTRGDGDEGEDITIAVLKYVDNIPKELPSSVNVEVRGEIYLPEKIGNSRNIAVGMCKRKGDALVPEKRRLRFVAWDCMAQFGDEREKFAYLRSLRFRTVPQLIVPRIGGGDPPAIESMVRMKEWFDGPADGVVFRCNNSVLFSNAGKTAHHPKGSIAYKFPVEGVRTVVEKIELSVGKKTGKITPIAHITPVMCGGAVVKKVSLGSESVMAQLGVYEGCVVEVARSGGVIPHIKRVVE